MNKDISSSDEDDDDIPLMELKTKYVNNRIAKSSAIPSTPSAMPHSTSRKVSDEAIPSCSGLHLKTSFHGNHDAVLCSPEEIIPPPQSQQTIETKPRRNKGKTAVITDSPYYYDLQEKNKNTPSTKGVKSVKRKVFETKVTKKEISNKKTKMMKAVVSNSETTDLTDEDNTQCIFCGGDFSKSKPGEEWISCNECRGWAHEACTSYDPKNEKATYVCDFCE